MFLDATSVVEATSCCTFAPARLVAKSVPDLTRASTPTLSRVPLHPQHETRPSPARIRHIRAKLAKYRRMRNESSASSLEQLGRGSFRYPQRSTLGSDDFPDFPTGPYRRRVYTMPSSSKTDQSDSDTECYRLRSFSVTSRGGVVNLGDLMCYRSRSDVNVTSQGSLGSDVDFRDRTSSTGSTARSDVPRYQVAIVGEDNVGKSSLMAQFMTSEYLIARNLEVSETIDENFPSNIVSILLDGEEAELECLELEYSQMTETKFEDANAIILLYSVTDKESFRAAAEALSWMRKVVDQRPAFTKTLGPGLSSKAIILTGNKSDLARKRIISTDEGRSLANKYDIKFIETSVIIHHNVDELLVGALAQVRLKNRQAFALSAKSSNSFSSRAKGFVNRILHKCDIRFRSCDNLHL